MCGSVDLDDGFTCSGDSAKAPRRKAQLGAAILNSDEAVTTSAPQRHGLHPVGTVGTSAVVTDAYPLWHRAVESVLTSLGVEVVGAAALPADGLHLVEQHRPDLLITDLDFGDDPIEGAAFVRAVRELHPAIRVVVLTTQHDQAQVTAAIDAGADAYALKTVKPEDLAAAIRQTFEHSIFLAQRPDSGSRSAASQPAERPGEAPGSDPGDGLEALTKREREILILVAQGHANAAIGRKLWVTEQTVKFHLSNIYRKLGVSNRTQASQWMHRRRPPQDPAIGA